MKTDGLSLVKPKILPPLDPDFRPAALVHRAFENLDDGARPPYQARWALEQPDGTVTWHASQILHSEHPRAAENLPLLERQLKSLLWSRGGCRIYFDGPQDLARQLQLYYRETSTGRFDNQIIGERIYEHPLELIVTQDLPAQRSRTTPLGRHLNGCRIGFDLGGSDRKVAAVLDGQSVFSEETPWDPVPQTDPDYHYDGIMHSLRLAMQHLPRVDAIGGSAAGVYINNQVKVASLFRGLSPEQFEARAKNIFLDLKRAWQDRPFEVVNDGEVTALAGSMSLNANRVLGIAMGTSMAAGYVTAEGNITSWLNELAFVPVDYQPDAPVDEWSGDHGCGVQYFSQQAVGRLLGPAGIDLPDDMPLPEKLKEVQRLMDREDPRAARIYQTIGTYLGYALAHYAAFYDIEHLLLLGRVTSGPGGQLIIQAARHVLEHEFHDLFENISFHLPGETEKRHGQAVAAASLPPLQTS